jgi:tetraacyldisaccharide-1-P 4'-kinase
VYPDLYTLQPKDELTIIYEQDPSFLGLGLHTIIGDDCLQIYLQNFDTAIVLINGTPVQPENQGPAL